MTVLTNVPTVGADIGTWGQELNDALSQLDTGKADTTAVYTKTAADARYVRTVNSVGPDSTGNVTVAGGGGGGGVGTVTKVNNISPDASGNVTLTAANVNARQVGVNIPYTEISGLVQVAHTGAYTDISGTPVNPILAAQVGAQNGVAGLDATGHLLLANMPAGFGGTTLEIQQNTDLTWPSRTIKTTDRTVPVFWKGQLPGPTISSATADAVAGLDFLVVLGAS